MNERDSVNKAPYAIPRTAEEWYARKNSGDFSDIEKNLFERWVSQDPVNRQAYENAARLWRCMDNIATDPRILAHRKIALENAPQQANRWQRPLGYALAASILLIVAILYNPLGAPKGEVYKTAVGGQQDIQLDDGSRIKLNTQSSLRVTYTDKMREIVLERGQAYFTVAPDADRPFVVAIDDTRVQALGTAFDTYKINGGLLVTLVEGQVVVKGVAADDSTEPQWQKNLEPGQQLSLGAGDPEPWVQKVNTQQATAWQRGSLDFDGVPLERAVREVNRYSSHQIRIIDPNLKLLPISGVFHIGDIDAFIVAMEQGFSLKARQLSNNLTMLTQEKSALLE